MDKKERSRKHKKLIRQLQEYAFEYTEKELKEAFFCAHLISAKGIRKHAAKTLGISERSMRMRVEKMLAEGHVLPPVDYLMEGELSAIRIFNKDKFLLFLSEKNCEAFDII